MRRWLIYDYCALASLTWGWAVIISSSFYCSFLVLFLLSNTLTSSYVTVCPGFFSSWHALWYIGREYDLAYVPCATVILGAIDSVSDHRSILNVLYVLLERKQFADLVWHILNILSSKQKIKPILYFFDVRLVLF